MKIGEGKIVDDKDAADKDKPVYGKNLLEEKGPDTKTAKKSESNKLLTKADILMGKDKHVRCSGATVN
jgi:hypothetical protein